MKAFVKVVALATAAGMLAAPASAQTDGCDPTANTRGDIAKAQFAITRAIGAAETSDPTKDLQEVLRLVDNGTDNPVARNYLRGEAYILLLSRPNAPAVWTRSQLGLTRDGAATVDLYAAADSAFTAVERASPQCATLIKQWRQQQPWLNALNASINALNAGQLDSAEVYANRSLSLDRSAPYAYSVLGSIAQTRRNALPPTEGARRAALTKTATEYWQQTLTAAGTDTLYADVRAKTMYEIATAASERALLETGAAKRAAAREAIKPWTEYLAVANSDLLMADALDQVAMMYQEAGDSVSIPKVYAAVLANPAKHGELTLVHAGVIATRNGRFTDAATLYNAALAQNPYSRDALNNLAASHIQNKEFPKAFPLIDKLVALDPSNPDNPLLYAFAYQGLYKGTQDKKLQKVYTDSLIYFNDLSEKAPVKVSVSEFTRRPAETVFRGTIKNLGKASKTYSLTVEFLDKGGAVVATETTSVGPVAANGSGNFQINLPKGGVYGYRYKPVT
ncbi:MAG TPA: tetratricopeptide repeat protein [Gemmatimonadaceae bacterium]|nr:tetratricopeptide repeat protein [Gemmatimonadaceae bacterium]